MRNREGPEIVFGLVGAIGTALDAVEDALSEALASVGYDCAPIKLSKLMKGLPNSPGRTFRNHLSLSATRNR